MNYAQTLNKLPPYLFDAIDKIKAQKEAEGHILDSLSIGDPDLDAPAFVLDTLIQSIRISENQKYPSYAGKPAFRQAVANWYKRIFGVTCDPATEIIGLLGSKEGLAHAPLAFLNPGDGVLVPNPGYPVYGSATLFAGGVPLLFQLKEENHFLPDFSELEFLIKKHPAPVKMLFLNYPNNPTGATATLAFFHDVVSFARKHNLIVCHDNAYSEIYFDGKRQPSFLEVPGAMDIGCEFHSLSKTFNMTGFRVGFLVGNKDIVAGILKVKTNTDSGICNALQDAAVTALTQGDAFCQTLRERYTARRNILTPALQACSCLQLMPTDATFYLWCKITSGLSSSDFVMHLIEKAGIITTPGSGFGSMGEGYVRLTLCKDETRLKNIAERIAAV